jgi:serine/threonine-protein kinase
MAEPFDPPRSSSGNYDLLDLLAEEFAARFRRGERPSLKEYTDRYPELADDIRTLFPALVDLEQADDARQEAPDDPTGGVPPPPAPGTGTGAAQALLQVGDYRMLREIGHGGMGVVYEAEQISLGRRVAVKILPPHVARDPKMLERFRREARAAARLHHTNIVPVFEVGREGEVCYYAMQFIQGQGLDLVYEELRRLRGRPNAVRAERPPRPAPGTSTHAEWPAVDQVVRSLLTGRFGDGPLTEELGGEFHDDGEVTTAEPARTEGDSRTDHQGAIPSAPARPSLPESAPAQAQAQAQAQPVMLGGSQLSAVESGRRAYARSIALIGLQAAQALAYAHARGIIHRDIKPSNLLLDTAGVVWITDFGLAKSNDDSLTLTGDLLGTLRYMAPERFRGPGDARSDVYALGLTLYELLTLEPAFEAPDRLRLIEQIKSVEPVRPRLLDRRIPRDLETVVLKAIDKDPRRRYQTAEALAEDLRRFRDDEPILARRATAIECYARWARRNPGVAVLGAVLTAVLVLATVGSLIVAGRMATLADRQRRAADSERAAHLAEGEARAHEAALRLQEAQARRDAERALAETEVERAHAEENFQRARAVVDQYFTQVSESQLLTVPGLQTLRRDLLQSALTFYQDYLASRGSDPELRAALAAVHLKAAKIHLELGDRASAARDYQGALPLYEALARANPGDVAVRNGLAECHYGQAECLPPGASRRDAFQKSATIRQELVAQRPADTQLREDLARSYQALGESEQSNRQAKQALESFLKARDIAASLVGDHPDDPAYHHDFARNLAQIAECLCSLQRHQDEAIVRPMAINHARAAYELAPNVVTYGRLYGHLLMREGDNLGAQGRYAESGRSLREAVRVEEKLIRENPAVPDLRRELAWAYIEAVTNLPPEQRRSDPVPLLNHACEVLESHPLGGPEQSFALTVLLAKRATMSDPSRPPAEDEARRRRDLDQAAESLRRAIAAGFRNSDELRSRGRSYFPSLLAREDVRQMLDALEARVKAEAEAVAGAENAAPASTPMTQQGATGELRPAPDPAAAAAAHQRVQADLAASQHAIALIHLGMGKALQAQGDLDGALAEVREAVRLRPDDDAFGGVLEELLKATRDRAARDQLVKDLRARGDNAGAEAVLREGAAHDHSARHVALGWKLQENKDLHGAIAEYRQAVALEAANAEAQRRLAECLRLDGQIEAALVEFRKALRLEPNRAGTHNNYGLALRARGDLDGAIAEFRTAMQVVHGVSAVHHRNLAAALLLRKDLDGAISEYREAIRIDPGHLPTHDRLGFALVRRGDLDEALSEFRAAHPDTGAALAEYANALRSAGRFDEAVAAAREAVRLAPGLWWAQYNLGWALLGQRDWARSAAAYREAVRLKPDDHIAHRELGQALSGLGDLDAAIGCIVESLRIRPGYAPSLNDLLAALRDRRKRDRDLAGAVQARLGLDPDLALTLNRLMGPLLARIHPDSGMAVLDALCRDHPDQVRFRIVRAQALVELGRPGEAAAAFAAMLGQLPKNPAPWFTDDPAGVYPAAVADPEVFERLTALRPGDLTLWTARIRHHGRRREWREAAAVATRLNAFAPPDHLSWHSEAALQSLIGDHLEYRRVCRGMLERFGKSNEPNTLRRTVVSCLLEPDALSDLGELAPLVERFSASSPTNQSPWSLVAAGFFEYRTGRFRAAIERLDPLPEGSATTAFDEVIRALACVIRAMAYQKLNQTDAARRQLASAEVLAQQSRFEPDRAGPLHGSWIDWLRYQVLRREAEGLLQAAAAAANSLERLESRDQPAAPGFPSQGM